MESAPITTKALYWVLYLMQKSLKIPEGYIAFGSYIRQVGGFYQGTQFPLQMKNNPLKITEMLLIKDQLL